VTLGDLAKYAMTRSVERTGLSATSELLVWNNLQTAWWENFILKGLECYKDILK